MPCPKPTANILKIRILRKSPKEFALSRDSTFFEVHPPRVFGIAGSNALSPSISLLPSAWQE